MSDPSVAREEQISGLLAAVGADYHDRDRFRSMFASLSQSDLDRIERLCASYSPEAWDFFTLMLASNTDGITSKKGEFLTFAAEIAPVAACFRSPSSFSVDRWRYMSTVIAGQRGNSIAPEDHAAFHRGLALTLLVDPNSVNIRPDASHLVWLGANWDALEPYVPMLIERATLKRDFVESLLNGSNGLPAMSSGIL